MDSEDPQGQGGHEEIEDPNQQPASPQIRTRTWWDKWKPLVEVVGALALVAYTTITFWMYRANKEAADATKQAADTTARQLELTERPWVSIQNARIVSPLIFHQDGAHVAFQVVLRNTGPSPAIDVSISPILYMLPTKEKGPRPIDRLCNNQGSTAQNTGTGSMLFPNADTIQQFHVILGWKQMKSSAKNGIIVITPVLCVDYRPAFKQARYYTGIQYSFWPAIFIDRMKPGSSIPRDKLPLERIGFFGETAH
jgi:hypothetical protein